VTEPPFGQYPGPITLQAGEQPIYKEHTFFVQSRYGNGPWTGNMTFGIKHLHDAIVAAHAKLYNEPYLFVQVVDETGKVHWSNEHGLSSIRDC
jgi:hypothetical protein